MTTIRDENTSAHYVDPSFPAVSDPKLVTTSAILVETPERVEEWRRPRALCVDMETSVLYILSYLAGIPSLALLAVRDNITLEEDCEFETELSKRVDRVF